MDAIFQRPLVYIRVRFLTEVEVYWKLGVLSCDPIAGRVYLGVATDDRPTMGQFGAGKPARSDVVSCKCIANTTYNMPVARGRKGEYSNRARCCYA